MPHINGWMVALNDATPSLALVAYADLIELAGKEHARRLPQPDGRRRHGRATRSPPSPRRARASARAALAWVVGAAAVGGHS